MKTHHVTAVNTAVSDEQPVEDLFNVHDPQALIDHWRVDSLITADQAALLLDDVRRHTPPERPTRVAGLVVEALGYLGAVIVIVAAGLVVGRFWADVPSWGHLTAAAAATTILIVAGFLAPSTASAAGDRLRSVLWLAATVTFAGTGAVVAYDFLNLHGEPVALTATMFACAAAAAFWYKHPRPLQHAAFFVSLCATVALALSMIPEPVNFMWAENMDRIPPGTEALPGVGVWCVGAVWLMLAWGKTVKPEWLGFFLGSVAMVGGAVATGPQVWGLWLGAVTVLSLIVLAVYRRDFVVLVVGAVGALQVLPQIVTQFFPGMLAAAGVLLIIGLALIFAAVFIARSRFGRRQAHHLPRYEYLSRPASIIASTLIIAIAAAATIIITASTLASYS